jgi:hypothetical protein
MKRFFLIIFISSLFVVSSAFALCEKHCILSRDDGGKLITLDDGTKWEVLHGDEINSNTWPLSDEVLLCNDNELVHPQDDDHVWVRYAN